MHRSLLPLVLLAACVLAPAAHAQPDPRARELLERVALAYGGPAVLEKVQAYRMEGTVFSAMRHHEAPTIRIFARPGRLKVLVDYEGAPEARLVDGREGWRNEGGGPLEPVTGPMHAAMVLQAARAGMPWVLYEHAADAALTDSLTVDGVACAGIEMTIGEGLVLRAWIHPGNHYIVRSQGLLQIGGMRTHFETNYSDFRVVDGVTFAFREENFASGRQTGITTLTRVKVNPPLGANEFRPPSLPERVRRGAS